jgi:hypothetical protein
MGKAGVPGKVSGGGRSDRFQAETPVNRSGIDVLATVKDGFAKRFAFKPLTASVRVDEWPGRGQLGKLTSRVKISLARPERDQFGRPLTVWPPSDSMPRAGVRLRALGPQKELEIKMPR